MKKSKKKKYLKYNLSIKWKGIKLLDVKLNNVDKEKNEQNEKKCS